MDQIDLFVCDLFDVSFKDDLESMSAPLYSLSNTAAKVQEHEIDKHIRVYEDDRVKIKVTPGLEVGHATIHDKDVIIYCMSHLMAAKNRNEPIGKDVLLIAHDLLMTTNRTGKRPKPSADDYDRLLAALRRLKHTNIEIVLKNEKSETKRIRSFNLLDDFDVVRTDDKKDGRMLSIKLELPSVLLESLEDPKNFATINPDYFKIRAALDRRLYELANRHCHNQKKWPIRIENLHKRSGSVENLIGFRKQLNKRITANLIPDYKLTLVDNVVIARPKPMPIGSLAKKHKKKPL